MLDDPNERFHGTNVASVIARVGCKLGGLAVLRCVWGGRWQDDPDQRFRGTNVASVIARVAGGYRGSRCFDGGGCGRRQEAQDKRRCRGSGSQAAMPAADLHATCPPLPAARTPPCPPNPLHPRPHPPPPRPPQVAPAAQIIALDVFTPMGASMDDLLAAISFVVSLQRANWYKMCSVNLSLGTAATYDQPCTGPGGSWEGDVGAALAEVRSVGVLPVVAAGNAGATSGVAVPGCVPAAVAVGATYDSNFGFTSWATMPECVDAHTYPNKVACFRCVFGPRGRAAGVMAEGPKRQGLLRLRPRSPPAPPTPARRPLSPSPAAPLVPPPPFPATLRPSWGCSRPAPRSPPASPPSAAPARRHRTSPARSRRSCRRRRASQQRTLIRRAAGGAGMAEKSLGVRPQQPQLSFALPQPVAAAPARSAAAPLTRAPRRPPLRTCAPAFAPAPPPSPPGP
jgi:hypothetical protein